VSEAPPPKRAFPGWAFVILLLAGLWAGQSTGFLSSNDGSHFALARALSRGETSIDPDAWMTLGVDVAQREGRYYSDRPPGTAAAALPAATLGAARDQAWFEASVESQAERFVPAGQLFNATKNKRSPHAPHLFTVQASAFFMVLHACLMGGLGLWALARIAEHIGGTREQVIGLLVIVGLATTYATYAAVLFSHISATALTLWALLAALRSREGAGLGWPLAAGFFGAWAIACDYSFVLVVVPLLAVTLQVPGWPASFAGALLPAALVAAYHHAAFGSVFAIGYDFNVNFEFARERGATFGGNPMRGAWALLGAGNWSGWLSRSPILLFLAAFALRGGSAETLWTRRWLLALLPWTLLICSHQTPTGGAGVDARYLIALVPFAGLGLVCMPRTRATSISAVFLLTFSVWSSWYWFIQRFELELLPHPLFAGAVWAVCGALWVALRRRRA
jgi:hypothetical protein